MSVLLIDISYFGSEITEVNVSTVLYSSFVRSARSQ